MKNTILKTIVTVCFIAMLILAGIYHRTVRVEDYSVEFMGTNSHIIAIAHSKKAGQKAIDNIKAKLRQIEKAMSYHDPNSQLNKINASAFTRAVTVEKDMFKVILKGLCYSKITDGKFDITIGPLVDLWKNAKTTPAEDEIKNAQEKVNWQNVILDANNNTVKFKIQGMKIDLGGIAKGYGIDCAVKILADSGCKGGLVDIGGDLRCFGFSRTNNNYKIALQNPAAVNDPAQPSYIATFNVTDYAIATSGDYRRFVQIDGNKISHIINPKTSTGAKKYSSVTVIAPKAVDADALATAISMMDFQQAEKLIRTIPDTEFVLIEKDSGKILCSAGIRKFSDDISKLLCNPDRTEK